MWLPIGCKEIKELLEIKDRKERWSRLFEYARKKGLNDKDIKKVIAGPENHKESSYIEKINLIGEKEYLDQDELPF